MSMYSSDNTQVNARIIRILWKQQQELLKTSPDCVTPIINPEDPLDIEADITGPKETPYEGGVFRVRLFIPSGFPSTAPKGFFLTKIFHPNVSDKGEICVNTLKRDWNPAKWSLYNLFEVIKCLMIVPFPQSSLNEEAGKIFMENYQEYFSIAKMLTEIHAKPVKKEKESDKKNNVSGSKIGSASGEKSNKNNNSDKKIDNEKDGIVENNATINTTEPLQYTKTFSLGSVSTQNNGNGSSSSGEDSNMSNVQNNGNSEFYILGNNQNMNNLSLNIARSFSVKQTGFLNWRNGNNNNNNNSNNINNVGDSIKFFGSKFKRSNSILENDGKDIDKIREDKPNLGNLPFIHHCGSNKSNAGRFLFQRSNTANLGIGNLQQSSSEEINKWLMRI